jgi:hypothetical protein
LTLDDKQTKKEELKKTEEKTDERVIKKAKRKTGEGK